MLYFEVIPVNTCELRDKKKKTPDKLLSSAWESVMKSKRPFSYIWSWSCILFKTKQLYYLLCKFLDSLPCEEVTLQLWIYMLVWYIYESQCYDSSVQGIGRCYLITEIYPIFVHLIVFWYSAQVEKCTFLIHFIIFYHILFICCVNVMIHNWLGLFGCVYLKDTELVDFHSDFCIVK